MKMLMMARLAANAAEEPGDAGSKNWQVAICGQLARRVLSHKMSLKVNTTVVQAMLLVPVWLVQVTVVVE